MTVSTKVRTGQTVAYTDTQGNVKAAVVIGDHDSIHDPAEGEEVVIPRPAEGYVHIYVFGFTGLVARTDVPVREIAETIPDYTIDGKLVGFVEAV
jgi:hypothetical protein